MLQPTHVTGLIGKWGLGNIGTSGAPNAQGFTYFFGQDTQVGCHNWYPWDGTAAGGRLYRQSTAVEVSANANATIETCGYRIQNCEWANDMYGQEAKKFIAAHADKPFFLCTKAMLSLDLPDASLLANLERVTITDLSTTTPHEGNLGYTHGNPVPWDAGMGLFVDKDWPVVERNFSAAVWAQDLIVGSVLDALEEAHIQNDTVGER